MTNARKDSNSESTMLGVSNADGTTVLPVYANPSNHAVKAIDAATGSDLTPHKALRDQNSVTTIMAVSSTDGVTLVPIYLDSATQSLLIKST